MPYSEVLNSCDCGSGIHDDDDGIDIFVPVIEAIWSICGIPFLVAFDPEGSFSWWIRIIAGLLAVVSVPTGIALTISWIVIGIVICLMVLIAMVLVLCEKKVRKAFINWLWPLESLKLHKEE